MSMQSAEPTEQPEVLIRTAGVDDVAELSRLELSAALVAYRHIFPGTMAKPTPADRENNWRLFLSRPGATARIAETANGPVGLVGYGPGGKSAVADCVLWKLYIVPEQSGRGLGSLLHDQAVTDLRSAGHSRAQLWVLERNIIARRMYEHRGWKLGPKAKSPWPGSGILELCYTLELGSYSSLT